MSLSEFSGAEKRRFKRVRATFIVTYELRKPIRVELKSGESHFTAVATDISVGGIGVVVNETLPVAAKIKLNFSLHNENPGPDRELRRWFELTGRPVHCVLKPRAGFHAGIQFENIPEEDVEFIRQYIAAQELRVFTDRRIKP